MIFLKLAAGLLFFLLGWVYLYKSNLVLAHKQGGPRHAF
jgi:hypothetical protein